MLSKLKLSILGLIILINVIHSKKFEAEDKPKWAKKDIRDFSEADLERLYDQWEADEEELPEDELPEHLRPPPKIEFDPNNIEDPEKLLQATKKGKTLMMFVRVKKEYSKADAESITQRWQTSLWNNHIQAERYMVDDQRAIFMFKDGTQAWESKDFLIEQKELHDCTIESKAYYGKHTSEYEKESKLRSDDEL